VILRPRSAYTARMDKRFDSADAAVADIHDGATIMVGGFVGVGAPWELIHALVRHGARNLTCVQTATRIEMAPLIEAGLVARMITSFPGYASAGQITAFERRYKAGEIELEIVPQGTLAERIRAGGAGIPAFYTPTGTGTIVAEGKPAAWFDGREYLLERWLKADFALIHAHRADSFGNLVYRRSGRAFNAVMATAATVTIAEADEVLEPGEIDPEAVHTPAAYVARVVRCTGGGRGPDGNPG
jgi:3-oxoadipate CoA-transferase, alpha subunit